METEARTTILPASRRDGTFAVSEMQGLASELFAKAGFPEPGKVSKHDVGLGSNPKTRSEAKWAVENATENAVNYYSSPENLQSLADDLRYLLPRYGVDLGGGEDGPLDPSTKSDLDQKYKETLSDPHARAVYTSLLVKIYDGAVDRLQKVAEKTGDRSILQLGELGIGEDGQIKAKEIEKIGDVPQLSEAYREAVKRDHDYMYELVQGEDGKTKIHKKKAPGASQWLKDTSGGIMETGSTDEALGYFMGRSVRAFVRLLPGFVGAGFRREVEKSSDIRAETAKVLEQIGELSKKQAEVKQPHARAGAEVGEEGRGAGQERSRQGEGNPRGGAGGWPQPEYIDADFEVLEDKSSSPGKGSGKTATPKMLQRGDSPKPLLLQETGGRERG
jgi:hypothetical protein